MRPPGRELSRVFATGAVSLQKGEVIFPLAPLYKCIRLWAPCGQGSGESPALLRLQCPPSHGPCTVGTGRTFAGWTERGRICTRMGLPGGTSGKEPNCQCRRHKRCDFNPWVGNIHWRRAWQPTPVFLMENPMDRGAWRATVHGGTKSRTRLKWLSMHACTLIYLSLSLPLFFFLQCHVTCRDLSSPIRDWTLALAVKVLSPNHWTTRELLQPSVISLELNLNYHIIPFPPAKETDCY